MKHNSNAVQLLLCLALSGLFACQSSRLPEAYNNENSAKSAITVSQTNSKVAASEAASGEMTLSVKEVETPELSADASHATITPESSTGSAEASDAVTPGKVASITPDYYQPEPLKTEAFPQKAQKKGVKHFFSAIKQAFEVDALELILAIFLPPIGVLLHEDGLTTKFWISLVLTLLFFFPGMIYAILVVTDTI